MIASSHHVFGWKMILSVKVPVLASDETNVELLMNFELREFLFKGMFYNVYKNLQTVCVIT